MTTTVLGAGISGLTAAYYLLCSSLQKVAIIESSNAVGGWIRSIKSPDTNVLFEKGPRTIRPQGLQGLNTLSLIEELELSNKVIPILSSHPTAKNRLIYVNKKLHKLPSSLGALFKTMSPFSKPLASAFLTDLRAPTQIKNDESIYSFVERRLGKEIADYVISPMICGICAGDAKEISVKFIMAKLFEAEQKHGSISHGLIRAAMSRSVEKKPDYIRNSELCKQALQEKWSVWSLNDGLQVLPDTLYDIIRKKGGELMFNSSCSKLDFCGEHGVTCTLNGKQFKCNHVISSLPASVLAPLLSDQHPILSEELARIKFVTVAVVNLAYKGNCLQHNAFGFLVPPTQKIPILGVIFDSCNFPIKDWTVLTVMMGGHWFDHYFANATEETIYETALKEVSSILEIKEKPYEHHVSILKNCIPQYTIGHHDRVNRIFSYIKQKKLPLSVIGSSYTGVGINDVIYSAKIATEELNAHMNRV